MDKDNKGRGYELASGKYVEIEPEELEAVEIAATHTIDIDKFVPEEDIDKRATTSAPITSCLTGRAGRRRSPSSAMP